MGREVRRVPSTWQHPKDERGRYKPLLAGDGAAELEEWLAEWRLWQTGAHPDQLKADRKCSYSEWAGAPPNPDHYMPPWPEEARTHLQMYETTSEGTPISPVLDSPEALARWLADSGASAFGEVTATYDQWLATIRAGSAPSVVITNRIMTSGVAFMGRPKG